MSIQSMGVIMPWKGRLALTFVFGVVRVLAFIGVGVASALIVLKQERPEAFAVVRDVIEGKLAPTAVDSPALKSLSV